MTQAFCRCFDTPAAKNLVAGYLDGVAGIFFPVAGVFLAVAGGVRAVAGQESKTEATCLGVCGVFRNFRDANYSEEIVFVRRAYFLDVNDPYKALKTTLKSEVNREAWGNLNSAVSRLFDKPKSGFADDSRGIL